MTGEEFLDFGRDLPEKVRRAWVIVDGLVAEQEKQATRKKR